MYYLDTASDHADRADRNRSFSAAAQHRNDAFRHDGAALSTGCTVAAWFNAATGFYGCDVLDAVGRRVNGGCGWATEAAALAAGFTLIEETV